MVDGHTLDQQLNAYINEYYDDVVSQCIEIHGKANLGKSGIDCAVGGNNMHLSFPSIEVHNREAILQGTLRMEANWCSAAQSKTGKAAHWTLHFRKEKKVHSKPCFKGEELRRLLEATRSRG